MARKTDPLKATIRVIKFTHKIAKQAARDAERRAAQDARERARQRLQQERLARQQERDALQQAREARSVEKRNLAAQKAAFNQFVDKEKQSYLKRCKQRRQLIQKYIEKDIR